MRVGIEITAEQGEHTLGDLQKALNTLQSAYGATQKTRLAGLVLLAPPLPKQGEAPSTKRTLRLLVELSDASPVEPEAEAASEPEAEGSAE